MVAKYVVMWPRDLTAITRMIATHTETKQLIRCSEVVHGVHLVTSTAKDPLFFGAIVSGGPLSSKLPIFRLVYDEKNTDINI